MFDPGQDHWMMVWLLMDWIPNNLGFTEDLIHSIPYNLL